MNNNNNIDFLHEQDYYLYFEELWLGTFKWLAYI